MSSTKIFVSIGVAIGLAGCNLVPQQSLYRWSPGNVVGMSTSDGVKPPQVTVTSQPVDTPGALSVKTLPERAAAAYIEALSRAASSPDALRKQLAKPIKKLDADASELQRVFVIDVQRTDVRPADRYTSIRIEIVPYDTHFRFVDYQSASTQNTAINIGTVSISRQFTGTAGISPTFGAGVSQLNASVGYTNSNASTHSINETAQLSVNVNPTQIAVQRLGGEGMDLVGNVLVQASLQADKSLLDTYFVVDPDVFDDKTNAFKSPANADISGSSTDFLRPQEISVCYSASYVDRVVTAGDATRDEGAQSVDFRSGSVGMTKAVVVGESETTIPVWYLTDSDGVLAVDTPSGPEAMLFDDYDKAQTFKSWLKSQQSSAIGKHHIYGPDGLPLPARAFKQLEVTKGFPAKPPIPAAPGATVPKTAC